MGFGHILAAVLKALAAVGINKSAVVYIAVMGSGVIGTALGMYAVASTTLVLGSEILRLDVSAGRGAERYVVDKTGNQTVVGVVFNAAFGAVAQITQFDPKQGIASLKQDIIVDARRDQTVINQALNDIQRAGTDQEAAPVTTPAPLVQVPTAVPTPNAPPPAATAQAIAESTPDASAAVAGGGNPTPATAQPAAAAPAAATPTPAPAVSGTPGASAPGATVTPPLATFVPVTPRATVPATAEPETPTPTARPGQGGDGQPVVNPQPVPGVVVPPVVVAPIVPAPAPTAIVVPLPTAVVIPDTGTSQLRITTLAPATQYFVLRDMVPGDSQTKIIQVANAGSEQFGVYGLTTSFAGPQTALWTDRVNGLKLRVERPLTTPIVVVYDGPVELSLGFQDLKATIPWPTFAPGNVDTLQVTFYLSPGSSNAVQNLTQIVNLTWNANAN